MSSIHWTYVPALSPFCLLRTHKESIPGSTLVPVESIVREWLSHSGCFGQNILLVSRAVQGRVVPVDAFESVSKVIQGLSVDWRSIRILSVTRPGGSLQSWPIYSHSIYTSISTWRRSVCGIYRSTYNSIKGRSLGAAISGAKYMSEAPVQIYHLHGGNAAQVVHMLTTANNWVRGGAASRKAF